MRWLQTHTPQMFLQIYRPVALSMDAGQKMTGKYIYVYMTAAVLTSVMYNLYSRPSRLLPPEHFASYLMAAFRSSLFLHRVDLIKHHMNLLSSSWQLLTPDPMNRTAFVTACLL